MMEVGVRHTDMADAGHRPTSAFKLTMAHFYDIQNTQKVSWWQFLNTRRGFSLFVLFYFIASVFVSEFAYSMIITIVCWMVVYQRTAPLLHEYHHQGHVVRYIRYAYFYLTGY